MKRRLFWAVFAACAALLLFKNLGSTRLWQDEAWTAVLARNALRYGVPKVYDGRNFVSTSFGLDHDSRGTWNYSPWLDIYVTAGSFALLGEGTFAARLPFTVFGFLTLLLLHKVSLRWSKDPRTADLALALTLLSVPFLLHARQCRYYVMAAFFTLYLYYAYHGLLESRKHSGRHVVLSSLGLFHSNFLVFFAALGGVGAHFLLFVPDKPKVLRRGARPLALVLLLLLPWCLYFRIFTRAAGDGPDRLLLRLENLRAYLSDADYHLFPALLALLFPFDAARLKRLKAPLSFMAGGLACLCLAPHHFFRYMVAFIPICGFLLAELFWMVYDRRREAALGLLGLLLFTRGLSASYWGGRGRFLKTDLLDFACELARPIREPVAAAADFLNRNAGPDDLLLVSYPDLPFMFYTKLRVVGGGSGPRRVRPEDVRWVLLRDDSEKASFPLDFRLYEKIPLDAPNRPWGDNPDPNLHVFRSAETPEPAAIYRRLRHTPTGLKNVRMPLARP